MNLVDIIIILVLISSFLIGSNKGIIKESVSFLGLILIIVIAYLFRDDIGNTLCKWLPFFQFGGKLKGIVTINILLYQTIAFVGLFMVLYMAYSIVCIASSVIQKLVNKTIILKIPSKLAGGVFGFISGYLLTLMILLILTIVLGGNKDLQNSKIKNYMIKETPILNKYTKKLTEPTEEIYNLVKATNENKLTTNEINLKSLDIMLKNKIIKKKTVEQLVVLDKLHSIKNIDEVLNKYK